MTISAHRRMALLAAFRPVEILSETTTLSRLAGAPDELRLQFDGMLDGKAVNVSLTLGGIWVCPLATGAAYDADGPSGQAISSRVLAAIGAA